MVTVLLLMIAVLLALQGALMLAKEWKTVCALWWRFRGKNSRKRIAEQQATDRRTEADRRAAAREAKELRNLWEYDGSEQQPIDVEGLDDIPLR